MIKQGEHKIDWCDYTWNPISGCKHGCPYCYLHRIGCDMTPRVHEHKLDEPFQYKNKKYIFVGSSGDVFGDWVDKENIEEVIKVCRDNPQHIFMFLTKNPKRYNEFEFPENCWCGTTWDGREETKENVEILKKQDVPLRFISFEPLLTEPPTDILDENIKWIIIGADSNKGADKPPLEWIDILHKQAKKHSISMWIKDNYGFPQKVKNRPVLPSQSTTLQDFLQGI